MRKIFLLILGLIAIAAASRQWQTDILGPAYQYTYIDQGTDYSGPVRSTVVRLRADSARGDLGALYVHGFNDYFFQADMGRQFADHGLRFYAVDLRKYGRSLMPGQTPFQARHLSEYFADIDSALAVMEADGVRRVVLVGHSTGGLITSMYLARNWRPQIRALVLNSPFLDWNQSKLQERILIPAVRSVAPLMPGLKIPQGVDDLYARSLLSRYGGEWDYDTLWKFSRSPAVEASWIAAIDEAHDIVQRDPRICMPILVMHSDRSFASGDPDSLSQCTDVVLDVTDIDRYGRGLGPDVTMVTVPGGLHDLALSAPAVREAMYSYLFRWLAARGL